MATPCHRTQGSRGSAQPAKGGGGKGQQRRTQSRGALWRGFVDPGRSNSGMFFDQLHQWGTLLPLTDVPTAAPSDNLKAGSSTL